MVWWWMQAAKPIYDKDAFYRATRNTEEPAPGFAVHTLVENAKMNDTAAFEIAKQCFDILKGKSVFRKIKALRIIKALVEAGVHPARKTAWEFSESIEALTGYEGDKHQLHGDALNDQVRQFARGIIHSLSETLSQPEKKQQGRIVAYSNTTPPAPLAGPDTFKDKVWFSVARALGRCPDTAPPLYHTEVLPTQFRSNAARRNLPRGEYEVQLLNEMLERKAPTKVEIEAFNAECMYMQRGQDVAALVDRRLKDTYFDNTKKLRLLVIVENLIAFRNEAFCNYFLKDRQQIESVWKSGNLLLSNKAERVMNLLNTIQKEREEVENGSLEPSGPPPTDGSAYDVPTLPLAWGASSKDADLLDMSTLPENEANTSREDSDDDANNDTSASDPFAGMTIRKKK